MVDLITNSSTELFVLDTEKAVEVVRGIIKEKEKEFPNHYAHTIFVDLCEEWDLEEAFGYYDESDAVKFLESKGYKIEKPNKSVDIKYIKIYFERGGMDDRLNDFIRETFNIVYHSTET